MGKTDHRNRRLLPSRALHLGREQQAAATEQYSVSLKPRPNRGFSSRRQ